MFLRCELKKLFNLDAIASKLVDLDTKIDINLINKICIKP